MSSESKPPHKTVVIQSIDNSVCLAIIPFVLSVIAGSIDIVSFLGMDGLFTAHITGNLVLLAAHWVAGNLVPVAQILSVPVFFVMLALTKLIVNSLERKGFDTLKPLLLFQLLLLASCFLVAVTIKQGADPNSLRLVIAGMLGVSAMAVQNALVQTSLQGSPSTAVMTTNITRFTMDIGEVLLGKNANTISKARSRALHTWPAIAGFGIGCGLGAAAVAAGMGLWAMVIPVSFAAIALLMSWVRCK